MKQAYRLALLALCAQLGACSVLEGDRIDYKSAVKKAPSLEVPPDLTQLSRETRYAAPGASVSAASQEAARPASLPVAVAAAGDVRVEREGSRRWLVVARPPEQLWSPVRDFWKDSGFALTMDQPELGLMETDWAENRAKLPQDVVRATLGKVFDSFYSTPERDRFRTRIERTPAGTEIHIAHRGLQEVYTDSRGTTGASNNTVWQPRASDAELENEFLRRLMVRLGAAQEQARSQVAAATETARPTARVARLGDAPVVQVDDPFDRAWRRVGLSLDRTGFTVEDRDRASGTYFVRYVEPASEAREGGLFSRVFSGSPKAAAPQKYRITLRAQGAGTTVSVLDAAGKADASPSAQRIVQVLADDLK